MCLEYKDIGEQELAKLCCEKDVLAEDELYKRCAAGIFTICRRYMKDADDAKDLMHDTFIRALDGIQTFNYTGNGSLFRWISRIAINLSINHIKRHRLRIVSLDSWHQNMHDGQDAEDLEQIPQEQLLEWISSLPDLRRAVFNLYCLDGYSHKEIAQMLNISEKGSAGVLAKAKKQLRGYINKYLMEAQK